MQNIIKERGRPREFVPEDALDRAMLVFREKGFNAASIGDLSSAMQLTTGSIYKAFNDKRTLFSQVFARYLSLRNQELRTRLEKCATGILRLEALLHFYVDSVQDIEGQRGCLVAGSAVEVQTLDQELAEAVSEAMRRNLRTITSLIQQGQQDGSVNAEIDADAAASLMLCIVLGMRVAGKIASTRPDQSIVPLALKTLS
ncbi:TetR/AcrR family transcriptional regulator [Pantoea sp. LMR881]|uniref:TetR/AcrR family transcriptional regulator n=1 Tax=Pantoea sp. LMR881 TaxID=3014336 RepID=UPI0022AF2919|nr:TetR/AcrR family transcriptional regulator [Pantoea sp. LMR881]MCZ4057870.1 TetR/AcrR family transcriptional regulator [Pantoea sp. LMR881]